MVWDQEAGHYVWKEGSSGLIERYEVGGAGRLLKSTDASGNSRVYAYGANGKLASVTDSSGALRSTTMPERI